jgi:acyl-homoserine-lactone acylase
MGYGSLTGRRLFAATLAALIAVALALALFGSRTAEAGTEDSNLSAPGENGAVLEATIRRDDVGIPHILANDYGGLGFGYGYAFAEDNICTIAESYVTVRAERSRYTGDGVEGTFGPNGGYPQRGNGQDANNLNSDFFYQRIIDKGIIEGMLDDPDPATRPAPEIREGVRGYVAGYNKYLEDTGVENLPDPRCRGAEWVKPISEIDAYRRFYQLALLASQSVAINGIGSAQPPAPGDTSPPPDPSDLAGQLAEELPIDGIGSNAYGLGSEATTNGKGVVLGNPHFPWDGPERFYQTHLTIPGEVNASGASLYGVPLVLIGHTDNLAWSHTVSTAFRFTPFEETTVPGSPTTYIYDGQPREMQEDEVTVMVNDGSGGLEPRTRTLYSTHHGPVMTSLTTVPLPWIQGKVFTMGDVNAANFRYLNHFFEVNQAQSVDRLDEIEKEFQGIPWVNTIAADSAGKAYYADIGAIPNVPNSKAQECGTAAGQATFAAIGLPILDGSRSACEWDTDADAVAPGIFGYGNLPKLFRDDYVTNSNDSYWLSNPEEPLEGFARIIGNERSARSLRTRIGLKQLIERFGNGPAQPASEQISRQDVQDMVFNNRQYAGELWRDELVDFCEQAPGGFLMSSSGPVDVSGACPALATWDVHDDLDSNGAVLFRRFAQRLLASPAPVGDPFIYDVPFDANDPVNTPRGLNTNNPRVEQSLADAVADLNAADIPLNAPLLGFQFEPRGTENIPIHGGPGTVGVFNAINVSANADAFRANHGWPNIPSGSSFVMVTQFTDGCADDRSIMTYSQSSNPNSPYWADQTRMFSNKQWWDPPFCEAELQAANLDETSIQGTAGVPSAAPSKPGAKAKKCKRKKKGTKAKKRKRCKRKRR